MQNKDYEGVQQDSPRFNHEHNIVILIQPPSIQDRLKLDFVEDATKLAYGKCQVIEVSNAFEAATLMA